MAALTRTPARGAGVGRVARGGLAGAGAAVVTGLAQFALVMVVTRTFGVEAAGVFVTATALALMAAGVAKLDAGNGLVFFIARARMFGYHGISGYIRAGLVPGLVVATVAASALYPHLGLLAAALPVMVAADVLLAATRGFGAMRPTVVLDGMLLPTAQLLLVTAAAWLLTPVPRTASPQTWLGLAWAAPYAVVLVLAAAALRGRVPRTPYLPGTCRDLWRHTAPRSLAAAIQAVFQRLDIVIVAALGGPAQAAVYTAATRFKVVGQLANQGLAQAAQPRLVRALADGELERARELYQATTVWLVVTGWPAWLGYALLAPWVLRLFGPEYVAGAPVALVLAATMMIATACGMVDVVLTAAGHTRASLGNLAVAVAATVALDLALIPAHGALGAALGWSGGMLLKNGLPLWQLHRRYGLRPFGRHSLAALRLRPWAAA
ncbi:lipopolysaccharide biosynthesis protein [Nonomuraea sp. NPDC047897]|uniref:lipopolysaccharide biosynthesis protein n=1 Tax=Nonomuraea sp. NPDC047897 TaxID=3364346 RepID=UPI00371C38A5